MILSPLLVVYGLPALMGALTMFYISRAPRPKMRAAIDVDAWREERPRE